MAYLPDKSKRPLIKLTAKEKLEYEEEKFTKKVKR